MLFFARYYPPYQISTKSHEKLKFLKFLTPKIILKNPPQLNYRSQIVLHGINRSRIIKDISGVSFVRGIILPELSITSSTEKKKPSFLREEFVQLIDASFRPFFRLLTWTDGRTNRHTFLKRCNSTFLRCSQASLMKYTKKNIHFQIFKITGYGPTDGRTNGRTDGPTNPLIEMRGRI